MVYFDVWKSPDLSLRGEKYIVTFIDDYSKRCSMYPIKKKSNVFLVFKEFKAQIKLESEKMIKCLKIDNGGEYTNNEFLAFYK